MGDNLQLNEKTINLKKIKNWRKPYIYALGGFFCAAAMAYAGLAPLIIAFGAACLSRSREEIVAALVGAMLALVIWQNNLWLLAVGAAAIAIFAAVNQFSRRKWLLWQQSIILGCLVLAGDLIRFLLWEHSGIEMVLINAVLTGFIYYAFCQLIIDGESSAKRNEMPAKDRLIYPAFVLIAFLVCLNGINIGGIMLQRVILVLAVLWLQSCLGNAVGVGAGLFFSLICVLSMGQAPVIIGYVGVCALASSLGAGYGKAGISVGFILAGFLLGWVMTDFAGILILTAENILAAALF